MSRLDQTEEAINAIQADCESRSNPCDWLELYGDQMFHYVNSRLNDRDAAEDIVQEALLAAVKSREQFAGKSSIKTWIFAILKNKLRDYLKQLRRQKGKPFSIGAESLDDERANSSFELDLASLLRSEIESKLFCSELEREEFWQAIEACANLLPANYQSVFRSRISTDAHSGEVAQDLASLCESLGITESNFHVRMFRARLLMRKCLEQNWMGEK